MPMSKEKKKRRMEQQVKADLNRMEAKLESSSPGILDMLRVYDGYEIALHHMDNYLEILHPEPRFDTTDGTFLLSEEEVN
jgi:hypothetical protein